MNVSKPKKQKPKRKILDEYSTQEQFAQYWGITQSAVSQMLSKGDISRGGTRKDWDQQYSSKLREHAAGRQSADGIDRVKEAALLDRCKRELLEIELKQKHGELWPRATINKSIEFVFSSIRNKMLALPSRQRSADPRVSPKQVAIAEQVVREILTELANVQLPASIDRITKKYFSDLHAAAENNGQPVGRRVPNAEPRKQRRVR